MEWAIRREILDRLTCSARWWSISILWLILFTQRDFVAWVVVVLPPMARSQRRTQCTSVDNGTFTQLLPYPGHPCTRLWHVYQKHPGAL